jgi:hypothetical protein
MIKFLLGSLFFALLTYVGYLFYLKAKSNPFQRFRSIVVMITCAIGVIVMLYNAFKNI